MTACYRTMATMLAVVACMAVPAWATVLPFDFIMDEDGFEIGNYDEMPQNYGDRADTELGAGGDYLEGNGWTPNVEVDYSASEGGVSGWWASTTADGFVDPDGAWPGVSYRVTEETTPGSWTYTLTPDAGYGVRVNSFDLNDYVGWMTLDEEMHWYLWGDSVGGVALADAAITVPEGATPEVVTGASAYNGTVFLVIDHLSGDVDGDIGLDNLNFDQVEAGAGIPGDFDGDGDVDGADFLLWQRDLSDATSLGEWQSHFGDTSAVPMTAAVPEPASLVLFGLGLCSLLAIRRKK